MKRYKFEIVFEEGNDEFWEMIEGTGCDYMLKVLEELTADWEPKIKLIEFTDQ